MDVDGKRIDALGDRDGDNRGGSGDKPFGSGGGGGDGGGCGGDGGGCGGGGRLFRLPRWDGGAPASRISELVD